MHATHLAMMCSAVGHYRGPTPMLPWIRGSGQASPDRHSLQPGTASRVPSGCRSGVQHASLYKAPPLRTSGPRCRCCFSSPISRHAPVPCFPLPRPLWIALSPPHSRPCAGPAGPPRCGVACGPVGAATPSPEPHCRHILTTVSPCTGLLPSQSCVVVPSSCASNCAGPPEASVHPHRQPPHHTIIAGEPHSIAAPPRGSFC
jgi:hypothetical protein